MQQIDWNLSSVWNNSLLTFSERPVEARDYMYASELGGSYIDRYLKMLGTKPTNPPNNRSLRKFQAGNIWEWIVGFVFTRAGILKEKQIRAEVTINGCLRVSGRLDFIAGGLVDFEKAQYEVRKLDLPEMLDYTSRQIIEQLKEIYGEKELLVKISEIKSVGSFVMERILKTKKANDNHYLQNYHYLRGNKDGIDMGAITYVCRDDCRIYEVPVMFPSPIQDKYEEDIYAMSGYYNAKQLPPLQPLIIFDEESCKFSKNWKVEYSNYLTKLYKFKAPADYADLYGKMATSFNYAFKRCAEGKNITDGNKETIRKAKKLFPDWDDYVELAKQTGVLEMVEEEEFEL